MRFVLTPELGRLAKWLRILGFDAAYFPESNLSSLLIQALRDNRIILTRNARFFHKAQLIRAVLITSDNINKQIREVVDKLKIELDRDKMFSRCIVCNLEIREVSKQKVFDKVPAYVFKTQEEFFICPSCQRIYWSGTHWGNVSRILEEITERNQKPSKEHR